MTASTLLPSGYLSTAGNQVVDASGADVRIASVGWNQNFGNIASSVAQMAADGFNTIRVSWVDASLSTDLPRIQQIVAAAAANGMKVIIDHHTDEVGTAADWYGAQQQNGLWYDEGPGTDGTNGAGVTGTVTAATFQSDWTTVAKTFAGNSTVIGFDLDNEPLSYGNGGAANWGQGGPTDIQAMYTTVGNAVEAVDPGALIIAEGIINLAGYDMSAVATDPVVLKTPNKVVYSIHDYPSAIGGEAVDSGAAMVQQMNTDWGYIEADNIAPVWIGEAGASLDGTSESAGANMADEQAWASTLVNYVNGKDGAQGGPTFSASQQGVSTDWWNWGSDPGQEPDGTLNPDGSLNAGQEAIYSQLRQTPIVSPVGSSVAASANDTTVFAGSKSVITDASGSKWTLNSSGQVVVNGAADATTANVVELAYVNGEVWQENTSNLWWGKTSATAAWSPTAGTSTSPLPVSANDATVYGGTAGFIMDATGNKWSITSNGQVAVNGVADTTTSAVVKLAYVNGLVWEENTSNLWRSKTSPTASWATTAGTSISPLPVSGNDATVYAGTSGSIMDANGNKWKITSTGQISVNGVTDTSTANVIQLAYVNGEVWHENTSDMWWGKTSPTAAWAPNAGTSTSPLPASSNDTTVLAGSKSAILDANGIAWTITSAAQVAVNGVADTTTANVIELAYVNGEVWHENTSHMWWGKTASSAAWAPNAGTSTSPLPTTVTATPAAATQTQAALVTVGSATVPLSQVSAATTGGAMQFVQASANTANPSSGSTVTSATSSSNASILPVTGNAMTSTDMLDLKPVLNSANWNKSAALSSSYLTSTNGTTGVMGVAETSATNVATLAHTFT